MNNRPYFSYQKPFNFLLWLALGLSLMAAQCAGPMPPLPAPPGGEVLPVAVLSPTGGELAPFGRSLRNGVQLAFDQWNRRGGPRLEARLYPTDCTFDSGQRALEQAHTDGIQLAIGPLCTEAALAAATQADAARLLLIAPTATHPLVTVTPEGTTRPTVFTTAIMPARQGAASAQFARQQLQATTAAMLTNSRDHYFDALAQAFSQTFTGSGGTIAYSADIGPAPADVSEHIAASRQARAQVIYLPATAATAGTVAAQVGQPATEGPILLGNDTWNSPQLPPVAVESYVPLHVSLLQPDDSLQGWAELYRASYAVAPDALAALGFEAASVLAQAVNQSVDTSPARLAATLETIEAQGLGGSFRFDARHTPQKAVPFEKIEQGQRAFAGLVTP